MIFQNFGSKAALFAAVVDRVADEVRAELARLAGRPGSAPTCWRTRSTWPAARAPSPPARTHQGRIPTASASASHALGAHGMLFADAFALIAEPELTEPARRAARTIAGHLADLIRRGQEDGEIRARLDPEAAAWLVLSVLATRAFRWQSCPARTTLRTA